MELYCSLVLGWELSCVGLVGRHEAPTLVGVEPPLKYHPWLFLVLTSAKLGDSAWWAV